MQQQEVAIRHPPVSQADRPGVVDTIVVAQDTGQPTASQHREHAIHQGQDEDHNEDPRSCERLQLADEPAVPHGRHTTGGSRNLACPPHSSQLLPLVHECEALRAKCLAICDRGHQPE